ncbi:MAG: flagellar hook-basal body complex protein FliE [Lawsonibacter sp.]
MDMQAIHPLWNVSLAEEEQKIQREEGPEIPFADIFQDAVENVRETDAAKNEAQYRLATGQLDNPAELVIASTQAAISVELLVQLRNKALDAYSELMRINM